MFFGSSPQLGAVSLADFDVCEQVGEAHVEGARYLTSVEGDLFDGFASVKRGSILLVGREGSYRKSRLAKSRFPLFAFEKMRLKTSSANSEGVLTSSDQSAFGITSLADHPPRDAGEMGVVREEENLGFLGELREHAEARLGPIVVEVDEQIVGKEREAHAGLHGLFDRRQAQRQEELIGGPLAHRIDLDGGAAVVRDAEQTRRGVADLNPQGRIPAQSEGGEKLARANE